MPMGRPIPGELWEARDMHGRVTRGVVSEVTPNVITLVSSTGNRHRTAPTQMEINWAFISSPRRTPFVCSRRGCSAPAAFVYNRGTSPDYTCARHAPSGTRLELLQDQPGAPQTSSNGSPAPDPCPHCGNADPIEVRNARMVMTEVSGWSCLACNNMWETITPGDVPVMTSQWWQDALATAIHDIERNARRATTIRCHPTTYGAIISTPDAMLPAVQNTEQQRTFRGIPIEPTTTRDPWSAVVYSERNRHSSRMSHIVLPAPDDLSPGLRPVLRRPPPEQQLAESPDPLQHAIVRPGSIWTHTHTGQTVRVISVSEDAVVFRADEQSFPMLLKDFVIFHRPFLVDGESSEPLPAIDIAPGDEWESAEGMVEVIRVDSKREKVVVSWVGAPRKISTSLTLREFATDKWRKIVRKSAFQRLLDDDDEDT